MPLRQASLTNATFAALFLGPLGTACHIVARTRLLWAREALSPVEL
jgi:hypothetical protein